MQQKKVLKPGPYSNQKWFQSQEGSIQPFQWHWYWRVGMYIHLPDIQSKNLSKKGFSDLEEVESVFLNICTVPIWD